MNTLSIEIETTPEKAEVCKKALELEPKTETLKRSKTEIENKGNTLIIKIKAKDLTALRASMNTYLRWVDMCLQITK